VRLVKLPDNSLQAQTSDILEKTLLDRVIKLRKLNKEMNTNAQVQRAQDMLEKAKLPFKKARAIWLAEVEALEIELRSRNIKFNICFDDIFENEENS
jgi:hypothetical protein